MKIKYFIIISLFILSCKSVNVKTDLPKTNTKVNYYENGIIKSVGNIDDFFLKDYSFRIGLWTEFYENGVIKESGNYKLGTYIQCCTSGLCDGYYSYKIGEWFYNYKNGKLKAKGSYRIGEKNIKTSCEGGDEINFGFVTDDWEFYDIDGNKIEPTKNDIIEIEKSSYLNEWNMRNE